jgi:RNA polymerase sigma factor (sigma-70 family)
MNVHISYKIHRTPDIDQEINYWTEKVQKRLQVFRPELVHLKGLIEQNSPREGTTVALNLRLPSGQMAAQESGPAATVAVKAAFNDLLTQISRHKDLLRNVRRLRRRRNSEESREPTIPFEETVASVRPATATAEEIHSYINANVRRLKMFVERELTFRENSGQLEAGLLNEEEVVDEAVARALDERIEKPDRLGLEAWLYRLVLQSMADFESRMQTGDGGAYPERERANGNEQASDEQRMQFYQPDESIREEDAIADRNAPSPEETAYTDEMIALVQFALRPATQQDREAFILHAIEGFSVEEISAITDRQVEQVQASLSRAREKLRHSLPLNNPVKERLLQQTGTD